MYTFLKQHFPYVTLSNKISDKFNIKYLHCSYCDKDFNWSEKYTHTNCRHYFPNVKFEEPICGGSCKELYSKIFVNKIYFGCSECDYYIDETVAFSTRLPCDHRLKNFICESCRFNERYENINYYVDEDNYIPCKIIAKSENYKNGRI